MLPFMCMVVKFISILPSYYKLVRSDPTELAIRSNNAKELLRSIAGSKHLRLIRYHYSGYIAGTQTFATGSTNIFDTLPKKHQSRPTLIPLVSTRNLRTLGLKYTG